MATVLENPFLSNRPRRMEEGYEEQTGTFGKCDCTSYSYFGLSILLFAIGTVVTVFALGDVATGHVLSNLGRMWLIGPIFICSGLMVATKCMLYLRRKSVIRMIIRQRQLFRHLQELAGTRGIGVSAASTPGPPSYEVIAQIPPTNESPPPSYAEAISVLRRYSANELQRTPLKDKEYQAS